jgi:hypothetical protein
MPLSSPVFSTNVREMKMREMISTRKIWSTNELHTLADKCAWVEEGRLAPKLPEKGAAKPDTPVKKNGSQKRSLKQVLAAKPGEV